MERVTQDQARELFIRAMREQGDDGGYAEQHGRQPSLAFPDESDVEIAIRVRMLMRNDLMHEAVCMAARDRICRLVLRNAALVIALTEAEAFIAGFEDDPAQDGVKALLKTMREALDPASSAEAVA